MVPGCRSRLLVLPNTKPDLGEMFTTFLAFLSTISFFLRGDRVSLYSPGCLGILAVDQVGPNPEICLPVSPGEGYHTWPFIPSFLLPHFVSRIIYLWWSRSHNSTKLPFDQ